MRVIIYRDPDGTILVGTESDEGKNGEIIAEYPLTMRGETSAFIAAQDLGERLGCAVYEVCPDRRLFLVQKKKVVDVPAEIAYDLQ